MYDLYAIANHSGSLIGGHYYTDVKDENGWHRFNDSMVNTLKVNIIIIIRYFGSTSDLV